ncbi:carbohydrate sulfotransferase 11-like [Galendromus occidentalis]|uniref:Carbohydrate sulfotransferase n=1 Tax=Galendromus occidentalis TaxID=34638 RepID=A0AAJ7SFX7_9ACAR|nr:carbohydrate sulfotransferase 11-like [Galendromus occidentalis]
MRRDLTLLLCGVGFLALLGYRYDLNATALLERKWFFRFNRRYSEESPLRANLDDINLTLPDSQEYRQARLKRVCLRYQDRLNRTRHRGRGSNFFPKTHQPRFCSTADCPLLVDLKHRFLFCFVQKVASTSAKVLFLREFRTPDRALRRDEVTALHEVANDKLLRVGPMYYGPKQLKTFHKAMFVRHPFERLVSVYEDKVGREPSEVSFFYDKYFKKFNGRRNITGTMSFVDFVDYLIETPRFEYDEHWMPYFERCEPCTVGYDFLGKLETADSDFEAMLKVNGLDELEPRLKHLNARNESTFVEQFFIQLERNQIMALYRIYRFDFELFGYNILNYIDTFDNGMF